MGRFLLIASLSGLLWVGALLSAQGNRVRKYAYIQNYRAGAKKVRY